MDSDNKQKQRIYSIPNIYDNINQLFMDNLEGPEITLEELLSRNIKDIMNLNVFRNLDKEFKEALKDFIYDRMGKKLMELDRSSNASDFSVYLNRKYTDINKTNYMNEEKYTEEITKYFIYIDPEFKNEIIKKTKELLM